MKQSDRFTITASNAYQRNHVNDETCGEVWIKETSAMLRRQHAAYVRMVNKMPCIYADAKGMCRSPDHASCIVRRSALLDALTRYKKGTR